MPSLTDEIATIRSLASSGHSPTEIAASIGREIGDVQTVLASVTLPAADSPGSTPSTPALKHIVFPFTFDTPGLAAGIEVYTPTVDDAVLDAWYELNTPWDGTTPTYDLGTFVGMATGLYFWGGVAPRLDASADDESAGTGMLVGFQSPSLTTSQVPFYVQFNDVTAAISATPNPGVALAVKPVPQIWRPQLRFTATHPLKIAVSQDGTAGGLDPAATKGAAQLHLLVLPAP